MKDTSLRQPDAELTLTGVSRGYNESSLFLSNVSFDKFSFTVSHSCVRGYFGRSGLLFSLSEKYSTLNVIAFMFIEIIFRC